MNNNKDQMSPRPGSLGVRSKLVLGFVGLLAILLAVGVESITLLDRLGSSIDIILRENYKSVVACERMKESLERMDSGALFGLAGEEARGRSLAVEHRPRFEAALQTELGNITMPGEGERAERLRQLYAAYVPVLERVVDPAIPVEERRALYFGQLLPTFQQVKATADEILEMNQENMVEANDRARLLASQAGRRMALMLLLGTALAGICIAFLFHSILGPLERLTQAARRIEGGDLDQAVSVSSHDEIGQLAGAFNSMTKSLRELRQSDQAGLLRARRVSELAIDNVPEAVAVLSADHRVELANRSAISLLGLRPGEPVPAQHGGWLPALLKRAEAGFIVAPGAEAEVRLPSDGRERFFRPRAAILRDGPDQPESFVLVLEDVTDRRRGGEVHAGLLASAAGDLEGALGPLGAALDSLRSGHPALTQSQKDLVDRIRREMDRLGQIAQNLLALSRVEQSRQQLHLEPVAPRALIDAAAHNAAGGFKRQQVKLTVDVSPAAPRVLADPERAGVVFSALFQNALAHTAAGDSVTVRAELDGGRPRFSVIDTGRGIAPDQRERIFEPFYQVPETEHLGGVGLGLAVARDIVQAHGGEIHCESEGEGHGATFWFMLPVAAEEKS